METADQGDNNMSASTATSPPLPTSCPTCHQHQTTAASHAPAPPATTHSHQSDHAMRLQPPTSTTAAVPYVASTSYPQQQYQYQQQQQPYSYPYQSSSYEQQQQQLYNNTNSTLAAAITLGSALGLTAAAAVRWLNGGDFTLFPPPIPPPASTNTAAAQQQQLVECVSLQTERQETLVNKLQATLSMTEKRHRFTNEAMARLQQPQQTSDSSCNNNQTQLVLLTSIALELQQIRKVLAASEEEEEEETDTAPLHARLEQTMDRLNAVLQNMETAAPSFTRPTTDLVNTSSDTPATDSVSTDSSATNTNNNNKTTLGSAQALGAAICRMVSDNESNELQTGCQMLYLYVVNVSEHPRVPRYRKIFTSNESFQRTVANLRGAADLLLAVGFVEQESSRSSNKVGCWEWLPPSIHSNDNMNQPPKANGANESLEPCMSPQKAWLGDSEATYLERLKEATAALEVLKAADTNTKDTEKEELIDAALLAAGIHNLPEREVSPESRLPVTTPPRPASSYTASLEGRVGTTNNRTPSTHAGVFQTPDTGSILSPPATKKQSRLLSPPGAFPSLLEDPLVGVTEESSFGTSNDDTSPVRVSENEEEGASAEDTMWK